MKIEVNRTSDADPLEFSVDVIEGESRSHHRVTLSPSTYRKLTREKVTPERCVQAAFEFLLEREPKESILSSFDVTVISRYFPEFERVFGEYLEE